MMVSSTPIFLSPLSHDLFNNQPGGASAPPFTSPKEDNMKQFIIIQNNTQIGSVTFDKTEKSGEVSFNNAPSTLLFDAIPNIRIHISPCSIGSLRKYVKDVAPKSKLIPRR